MEDIKKLLKDALKKRGYGYLNLQNVFNAADADGNGGLNWNEFQECLKACYLTPSQKDLRAIFRELDKDGNNMISVGEFMAVMREDLSPLRQGLVLRAFNKIDTDEDGVINMRDIGAVVNFPAHPEVRNGNMSCMNFMVDFFETLNSVNDTGSFTERDFVDYYSAIAAYDDDEHFIDCVTSLWNIRKADVGVGFNKLKSGNGGNKSSPGGGSTNAAQSQEVSFISETMDKLRKKLEARGTRGIVGLQRKMKSMDDDGSKSLNMVEFKKALKEMDLLLTDEEYHTLFDHFDKDRSGSLSFDEFLEGVRGPMNARRMKMVYQAFHVLDKDSRGLIEPSTIMNVYDASKHPDVLSGKKAVEDVLEEFLATFEVGGDVDGKVTRDEFVNYYNNVSSSIDNDDYFELMIRNAWHISGGTGQAANSANKRVLVTHSDGSQSVQEIKDDLGLKADDKAGMIRRLKAQGVDAASISTSDADLDNRDKNALINKISGKGSSGDLESGKLNTHMQSIGAVVIHEDDKKTAMAGPNDSSKGGPKGSPTKPGQEQIPSGIAHIITKLLKELKSHGAHGFVGLQRKFKIMDDDGSKGLDMSEFKKGMNELNMSLSSGDLQSLFKFFDVDNSNSISFEEFIQGVREPLNDHRLSLIHMAFDRLDKNGDGSIDGEEIASCYDASKHPEVIAGRKTRTQVLTEFLSTFDVGGVVDGKVTRQEFVNYYHNISASIDNDDYFELMIRNAWHISGGTGWAANSANKRVLVTHSDGSQSIEEIKNDLGMKAGDKDEMMRRLKDQGLDDIVSIAASDADVENADKLNVKGSKAAKGTLKLSSSQRPPAPPSSHHKTSPGLAKVLQRVQEALKKRGAHGFLGLQRRFRAMDDDSTKSIDLPRFKSGMQTMGLDLNEKELEQLFLYFDTDSSRTINFDEFIIGLRAPLTENRNRLVQMAFSKLDKDGNGTIDGDEIASTYNASQHPDVLAGKRSEREVLTEFMSTFEVGGEVDGKVTREEFVNYYTNVGASIDNEDYFELMIRNAWHISGGTGWAANSANKRVLVTHSDGSQSIQVIENDLGMRADDKAEMMKRLKAQGIDAVSIQSNDVDENGKPLVAGGGRQKSYVNKRRLMSMGQATGTGLPGPKLAVPAQGVPSPNTSPTKNKGIVVSNARLQAGSRNKMNRPGTVVRGILEQIQKELYSRGVIGLVSLQRKFRSLMEQGSTGLSVADIKALLKDWSIHLDASHLRALYNHFDTDNSGGVSFDEFIFVLRHPLPQERLTVVSRAFEHLDPHGKGSVDADTLIAKFNVACDPSVLSGEAEASSVLQQFMETFDVGAVMEGRVTRGEFINYYTNVSIFFDSDDAFEALLKGVWSEKVVVKHARSTNINQTSVEEEKHYEAGTKPSTAGRAAKVAGSMSMQDGMSMKERGLTSTIMKDAISEEGATYGTKATLHGKLPKQLQSIMVKLKHELKSRGARGYVGLQRKFRIMDDDGNKQLNLAEFKKGMTEMNMGLQDTELRHLFEYFDEDNSGSISSDEFIKGVRDPINERRRSLLNKAFDVMDKDKSGVIDGEDIADAFDASQHPDVLRGKKTAGDVLSEFLATFDVGGVVDGKVTRDEFINYYTNISASIDNDDYFELMIRNAWHITGGSGWSENSSNRRVLVTHSDGSQSVEEIKDDLGLKADDRKGMIRRLKAQGVDVVDIKLFG